ncbi:hypothetical protein HERIO_1027 [Hepatospora eriocheir]|uniref:Transmembrane protein n=1 Tax=Hepatospora eriocheir TaxID=1081669 RepID=A0A1X0QB95_9MICR|nr:hypothetical protein HERIO_1027 [Hepatospora eriocheir]
MTETGNYNFSQSNAPNNQQYYFNQQQLNGQHYFNQQQLNGQQQFNNQLIQDENKNDLEKTNRYWCSFYIFYGIFLFLTFAFLAIVMICSEDFRNGILKVIGIKLNQ